MIIAETSFPFYRFPIPRSDYNFDIVHGPTDGFPSLEISNMYDFSMDILHFLHTSYPQRYAQSMIMGKMSSICQWSSSLEMCNKYDYSTGVLHFPLDSYPQRMPTICLSVRHASSVIGFIFREVCRKYDHDWDVLHFYWTRIPRSMQR